MKSVILIIVLFSQSGFIYSQWVQTSLSWCSIKSIEYDGTYIYAGTDGNGIYRSSDDGATWFPANSGLLSTNIWSLKYYNNKLYAGTTNGVYLSIDNGESWSSISNNLPSNQRVIISIEAIDSLIFIGTGNGSGSIYKGIVGEYNWAYKIGGAVMIPTIHFCKNSLIASKEVQGIIKSDNLGDNWSFYQSGFSGPFILRDITSHDSILYAALNYKGLYKCNLNDNIWEPSGLQNITYLDKIELKDSIIVASSLFEDKGVFISNDLGQSWDTINDGLLYKNITALKLIGNSIFAGTNNYGMWRYDLITHIYSQKTNELILIPKPS